MAYLRQGLTCHPYCYCREGVEARKAQKQREYNMEEDHDRRDERKIAHLLPPRHDRCAPFLGPTTPETHVHSW